MPYHTCLYDMICHLLYAHSWTTLGQVDGRSKKASIKFDADGVVMEDCVLSKKQQGITWWHVKYAGDGHQSDDSSDDDLFGEKPEDSQSQSASDSSEPTTEDSSDDDRV